MKKLSALLLCALLITAVGCGSQNGSGKEKTAEYSSQTCGYYTLNLKINPDVSFLVDEKNQVIGVVTNNDDARDVYNNITFSSYALDVVVNEWASQCEKMGFNTHMMEVGICGSEEEISGFNEIWTQLKNDFNVFNGGDIQRIEEQAEIPVCEFCKKQLFDVYEVCPNCGHEVGYDVVVCFCGAKMATASKPCPICHLHNLTGEYEEGWGPEGREFLYCFCGSTCDINTGVCPVCHMNNFTGAYENGYGNQEVARCFCGSTDVDWTTGICRTCHLNNGTGEIVPDPNCSYCHGTGRIDWVCPGCGGDGAKHPDTCFQCGGTGTDFVTPGSGDGPGWWETCSNCHGTGLTGEYVPGGCNICMGIGVDKGRFVCDHCWK